MRLEAFWSARKTWEKTCFNSLLVRLEVSPYTRQGRQVGLFQFLIGAIGRVMQKKPDASGTMFQFLIGAIGRHI